MEDMKNTNEVQTTTTPQATFTQEIGKTTYIVGIHFSKTSKETLPDKVKKLILSDLQRDIG